MSTPTLALGVLGIGLWAEGLPGWSAARPLLRDGRPADLPTPRTPPTSLLAAAERRRASASVVVALATAEQACAMAGMAGRELPSVFTSTHGELELTDYLCSTLAADPTELSPTRFHNSVHNAASGYWTQGAGCRAASTALSAWQRSFAAGLLEAGTQALCSDGPVLLVAYDGPAPGPLGQMAVSSGLFGAALVLAPAATAPADGPGLQLALRPRRADDPAAPPPRQAALAALIATNPMAHCLPLFEALACEAPARLSYALSEGLCLEVGLAMRHTRRDASPAVQDTP